jgi:hypothetical protein
MSRRTKIIIALVVALAVLLLAVLIWWLATRPTSPAAPLTNTDQPAAPQRLPVIQASPSTIAEENLVKEPSLDASLKAIARTFAERFGSFSNEGNFVNLEDLRSLMTATMQSSVDAYIAQELATAGAGQAYYGITTKALSANVASFDQAAGQAEVLVATQRQEAKGTTSNPRVFYQTLKLSLDTSEGSWKVNAAEWQ